jgi:hypothetical protein
VAVPLSNHLFAALALGASFVIGRRWGVGALSMLATSVVLSFPLIGSTQPGQMYNDVMAAALLMAAVALLVDGELDPRSVALAGAALGASIGTKLSVLAVVGALAVGVLAITLTLRMWRGALAFMSALSITAGFWFARNWVVHGSPVPYMAITLGPIRLHALASPEGENLLDTLRGLTRSARTTGPRSKRASARCGSFR